MKKLLALLLLFVLVACTAKQAMPEQKTPEATPVAPEAAPAAPEAVPDQMPDDTAARLAREQEERIIEAVSHPPKVPQREKSSIVKQMLAAFSIIESYQFKTPQGVYYVRGDNVRFLPFNAIRKSGVWQGTVRYPEIYIDEVIVDRETKTATGYCTGVASDAEHHCVGLKLYEIPFSLNYTEVAPKLPQDWAEEYLTAEVIDEEYQKYYIKSIETVRVRFKDGTEMYFLQKAGLPIRIVKGPLELYAFDDLVINQARPEDVMHRSRSEIPQEELFYRPRY